MSLLRGFNFISSLLTRSEKNTSLTDQPVAQKTNVRPKLRPKGKMPSMQPTDNRRRTAPSKSRRDIGDWIQNEDPIAQDPIEVSDDDEDPKFQAKRTSQVRDPSSVATGSTSRNALTKQDYQNRQRINPEERRLLGDCGKPKDAVVVEIPCGPSREATMAKIKTSTGGPFRPVNTLNPSPHSVPSGKSELLNRQLRREPSRVLNSSKRNRNTQMPNPEPPQKKQRLSFSSPDVLQEQGSKFTKMAIASPHNDSDVLSSLVAEPSTTTLQSSLRGTRIELHNLPETPRFSNSMLATDSGSSAIRNIKSGSDMVISDDEMEDLFTREATSQRKLRKQFDDDITEVQRQKQSNGSAHDLLPKSTISDGQSSKLLDRMEELDEILPDKLMQTVPSPNGSPDPLQISRVMQNSETKTTRRAKTRLVKAPSNFTGRTETNMVDSNVVAFQTQRTLFTHGLVDATGYVFSINIEARTFRLEYENTALSEEPVLQDTSVNRIHKVSLGQRGAKIKIDMSNIPGIGHQILLELKSHKCAYDFAILLSKLGKGIDILVKDDSMLDRIFDQFVRDLEKTRRSHTTRDFPFASPYFKDTKEKRPKEMDSEHLSNRTNTRSSLAGTEQSYTEHRPAIASARRHQRTLRTPGRFRSPEGNHDRIVQKRERSVSRSREYREIGTNEAPDLPRTKPSRFAQLVEPWKTPLIFPKHGKRRATINFDDLSRLDDDEFLNDTIITFFLRYLENYLEQENESVSKKSHFFNTYFYEKLRQNPNDKRSINYEGVKKWTEKVNLFSRDFIIVPVNENLHWYVAIICNLPWLKLSRVERQEREAMELLEDMAATDTYATVESTHNTQQSFKELSLEDRERQGDIVISDLVPDSSSRSDNSGKKRGRKRKSERVIPGYNPNRPTIVTFDSLDTTRYPTVRALKQYIVLEGREKFGYDIIESDIQGLAAKKIPMQNNYSDCGLYVCAYLEKFTQDPFTFMKQEIGRIPQVWPDLHSHDLRERMLDLIVKLHEEQEGSSSIQFPRIGEILLPPVQSPLPSGGEYSKINPEGWGKLGLTSEPDHHLRKQKSSQGRDSGSDDELTDSRVEPGLRRTVANGTILDLTERPTKEIRPGSGQYQDGVEILDSNDEDTSFQELTTQDKPAAMAKRIRDARSPPGEVRHVRSISVSTDFLNSDESFEPGFSKNDDHDRGDDTMLV